LLEDDESSGFECLADSFEVGEQQSKLTRRVPIRTSAKQDHGRRTTTWQGQQCAKISICRNDDAPFVRGSIHDLIVRRSLHVVVADMDRVMTVLPKPMSDKRRQGVVDEKPHCDGV
jgi:hypothetical protein